VILGKSRADLSDAPTLQKPAARSSKPNSNLAATQLAMPLSQCRLWKISPSCQATQRSDLPGAASAGELPLPVSMSLKPRGKIGDPKAMQSAPIDSFADTERPTADM
jgi:hypothetical protein